MTTLTSWPTKISAMFSSSSICSNRSVTGLLRPLATLHLSLLQAADCYNKALASSPTDDAALVNRSICYVVLGHSKLAMKDLDNASESLPADHTKLLLLLLLLIFLLSPVLSNPYAAHAYFNRGNLLREMGRLEEGDEKDYRKSIPPPFPPPPSPPPLPPPPVPSPPFPPPCSFFPAVIELQPDHWPAVIHYGMLLGGQGKASPARKLFTSVAQRQIKSQ